MEWLPIGPDFVFTPRDVGFQRLSRRNEAGRQGFVQDIAVDPTNASTIYVTERPGSGGTSAFRTRDEGRSWTPIADSLQQTDPDVDPFCVAVNPDHPEIIYLGTYWHRTVHVSGNRGEPGSWSTGHSLGGRVRKLIVDPRTSSDPTTTVLYAATEDGFYRSPDGGVTWSLVLGGHIRGQAAWIPRTGTAHFYAGVTRTGIFHTTDPAGGATAWTNLSAAGIGLPAYTPASATAPEAFDIILLDLCPRDPSRVYAWHTRAGESVSLHTTADPLVSWSQVPWTGQPSPLDYYGMSFAVAPNSPGDGVNDILMFGSVKFARSKDAGRTWHDENLSFHQDQHAIAFAPLAPSPGSIPATYIGCDGGIGKSANFADPAYAVEAPPADFNELELLSDSAAWQNLDHGKQSSAIYQFTSDRRLPALTYVGCQDTAVNAGTGALGWRGLSDGDAVQVAMAPGPNGVVLWAVGALYDGWPGYRVVRFDDHREPQLDASFPTLDGRLMAATSPFVVGLDDRCLAGVEVRDTSTTLTSAITAAPTPQAVTPASMNNIIVGSVATIDDGTANAETVTVTATTASTFTATFAMSHSAGATVVLTRAMVARIAQDGTATRTSQDFVPYGHVSFVSAHPGDADVLYCATDSDARNTGRLWRTTTGSTAGPGTVWSEISANRPSPVEIRSMTVNGSGEAFVVTQPLTTVSGTRTPLFRVSGGSWEPQTSAGFPDGPGYGPVVADPLSPDLLYVAVGSRVYRAGRTDSAWQFSDISTGLPGPQVNDLWVGNIGNATAPRVLLRAAVPTRGVWEVDVTPGATSPAVDLYVRDNLLDIGWLHPSPDGLPNPYKPRETVRHYHCEDIKIDVRQRHGSPGGSDFYQTDPEGNPIPPLSHVLFDQLRESGSDLPQAGKALVHVQVHNRSSTPASGVQVWAIYCNASAGLPSLATSPSMGNAFPFWSQFSSDGTITPNLPADSPWKAIGAPQTLPGIDAAHPQVASWAWFTPELPTADNGHVCMVAFVHSPAAPVGENVRMNVDEIAPTNRQVGQKNLHAGPRIPPEPVPGRGGARMREYVEFHNPTAGERRTDLVFDLRGLPREWEVTFLLTPLRTEKPLRKSLFGVSARRKARRADLPVSPVLPTRWPTRPPGIRPRSWIRWLRQVWSMLRCVLRNVAARLIRRPTMLCVPEGTPVIELPSFAPIVHRAEPSASAGVRGVLLPAFGKAAAYLSVRAATGRLPAGAEYRFEVQQRLNAGDDTDGLAGGSTYVVSVAGHPEQHPPTQPPDTEDEERRRFESDIEKERLDVLPVWTHEAVKRARAETRGSGG
ncbi:hypothetical protein [Streptomyces sp. 5-6(2022)]|uniref:WD40/YVTN/BNR-like repeat-containing protein n=1 Tax=Streptomyces sp. 5-6(2022) TaxID=2936510 RepID=UPI0023B8A0E7|nr:hypothetical protein [Streptomyces sp. 5-6(2022)]